MNTLEGKFYLKWFITDNFIIPILGEELASLNKDKNYKRICAEICLQLDGKPEFKMSFESMVYTEAEITKQLVSETIEQWKQRVLVYYNGKFTDETPSILP